MKFRLLILLWTGLFGGYASDQQNPQTGDVVLDIQAYIEKLYQELTEIDKGIQTPNDVHLHEKYLKENRLLMETFFQENKKEITAHQELLFSRYAQYMELSSALDKKINRLQEEGEKELIEERLTTMFDKYLSDFQNYEAVALLYVENNAEDSLNSIKLRANTAFMEINNDYFQHKKLVEDNPELKKKYENIKLSQEHIQTLMVSPTKWGDIIFKGTVVLALLIFVGNMVKTKLQFKKTAKNNNEPTSNL
jgi:hypothetical protein